MWLKKIFFLYIFFAILLTLPFFIRLFLYKNVISNFWFLGFVDFWLDKHINPCFFVLFCFYQTNFRSKRWSKILAVTQLTRQLHLARPNRRQRWLFPKTIVEIQTILARNYLIKTMSYVKKCSKISTDGVALLSYRILTCFWV